MWGATRSISFYYRDQYQFRKYYIVRIRFPRNSVDTHVHPRHQSKRTTPSPSVPISWHGQHDVLVVGLQQLWITSENEVFLSKTKDPCMDVLHALPFPELRCLNRTATREAFCYLELPVPRQVLGEVGRSFRDVKFCGCHLHCFSLHVFVSLLIWLHCSHGLP